MTSRAHLGGMTYQDLLEMPDDGLRHELIDGAHFVTPSPNIRHQRLVGRLHYALMRHVESQPGTEVFLAPLDVVFSDRNVVEPDVIYVSAERSAIVGVANLQAAPDLVVEVLSPGTKKRDLGLKRDLYERWGVPEYWVVDPDHDVVHVHRRTGPDGYDAPVELRRDRGQALTSPLLPGWSLSLDGLFA